MVPPRAPLELKGKGDLTKSAIDPPSQRTFPGFDNRTSAGPRFRPHSGPTSIHYQGFDQKPLLTEICGAFFSRIRVLKQRTKAPGLGAWLWGGLDKKTHRRPPLFETDLPVLVFVWMRPRWLAHATGSFFGSDWTEFRQILSEDTAMGRCEPLAQMAFRCRLSQLRTWREK